MQIFRLLNKIIRVFANIVNAGTFNSIMRVSITRKTFLNIFSSILYHKLL